MSWDLPLLNCKDCNQSECHEVHLMCQPCKATPVTGPIGIDESKWMKAGLTKAVYWKCLDARGMSCARTDDVATRAANIRNEDMDFKIASQRECWCSSEPSWKQTSRLNRSQDGRGVLGKGWQESQTLYGRVQAPLCSRVFGWIRY